MTKEMSLYLDVVRFSAALAVLIAHSARPDITGAFLWQVGWYAQTAVIIFFVLSGYVISFVSATKEKNIVDYSYARISRLYSVVIPALLITFVCNGIGNIYIKDSYSGPWAVNEGYEYYRLLLSFVMLHDIWDIWLNPTNNEPFWSITFEATYYVMFALFFYIKNIKIKTLLLITVALIAGPTIVLLFPIWLFGYYAYRFHAQSKYKIKGGFAYSLSLLGIIILLLSPLFRGYFNTSAEYHSRESIIGDYIGAVGFCCNLLAAPYIAEKIGFFLFGFKRVIVFFAGLTFSLYLFHLPLVRLFGGISPFIDPSSTLNRIFVFSGTFAVVILFGLPCEKFKRHLNKALRNLVAKIHQLGMRDAVAVWRQSK